MGDRRHDGGDHAGFARGQAAGDQVGDVAEAGDRLPHARGGLRRDAVRRVDDPGNGHRRDARGGGHIGDLDGRSADGRVALRFGHRIFLMWFVSAVNLTHREADGQSGCRAAHLRAQFKAAWFEVRP